MNGSFLKVSMVCLVFSGMPVAETIAGDGLDLAVQATVDSRCEISNSSNTSYDLSAAEYGVIDFSLYCNSEMRIALTSENGGLLHEVRSNQAGSDDEFIRLYVAELTLVGADFKAEFGSADLKDGEAFDVPGVVFDETGRLKITLDRPIDDGYAGEYKDRINLTVTPSLAIASS